MEKERIKLDPDMPISELVENYPEVVDVLQRDYEFHCVNCILSGFDTLEAGAEVHGIVGEEFEDLLKHLEEIINND